MNKFPIFIILKIKCLNFKDYVVYLPKVKFIMWLKKQNKYTRIL